MSKNFEKEYKEYLNAQAPDLWDRIEAGVEALEREVVPVEEANPADAEVVPISGKKSKKAQKKRRIRYQHYRMIASVAACLFALVIIVPIYLLTGSNKKGEIAMDSAPQMVENVTIQNVVVDAAESEMAETEAVPMEEETDETTEIEIPAEMPTEELVMAEEMTEQSATGTGDTESLAMTGAGENAGQVADPQEPGADESISDMLQEGDAGQQKELSVTILGEGVSQEGGVMYTAAENASEASATVSLFVPEGSGIVLAADGVYVVMVQQSQDGDYYEVLSVTE